jgi:hypothetical protein
LGRRRFFYPTSESSAREDDSSSPSEVNVYRLSERTPIGGSRAPDPSLLQPKNAAYLKQLQTVWNTVYVEKR